MSTSLKTKQATLDAIKKWQPRLGLQAWAIHVTFDVDLETGTVMRGRPDEARMVTQLEVRPNVEEMFFNYLTLEKTVLHELVHCIVSGHDLDEWGYLTSSSMRKEEAEILYAGMKHQNELLTTRLCHLFWQAYETTPWNPAQVLQAEGE